jgi:two-component system copper resistance phosphate regulon response regulator CusR
MNILIIEDDAKTVSFLRQGFVEEGYTIDSCATGEDAIPRASSKAYDVVLLDVALPGMDGWDVLKALRHGGVQTPVLILSASGDVESRVKGLDLGADDYLVKPFAFSELLARLRSLRRRSEIQNKEELKFADVVLNFHRHKVTRAGKNIELTPKEFQLLGLLMEHRNEILSQALIAERVWEINNDAQSNLVEVHVRRLRAKIDGPFERKLIQTVRGRGYVLR